MTKIKWLSIIRVLGLLLVLIYHFNKGLLPGGFLGVDMFFTLSGYLIAALLIENYRKDGEFRFLAFIKRRFLRIFPPLLLMIAMALPFALLISPDFTAGIGRQIAAALGFVTNYFEILTGGSYENSLLPHIFIHTWTLAVEMHFYIFWGALFAGLALLLKHRASSVADNDASLLKRFIFALSLLMALFAYINMQTAYGGNGSDPSAAYFGTLTRGFTFMLGTAAGALFGIRNEKNTNAQPKKHALIAACGIALSIGVIIYSALTMGFSLDTTYRYGFLITSLLTVVIIKCVLILNEQIRDIVEPKLLTVISELSYCLFLFHWPLYIVFSQIFQSNFSAVTVTLATSVVFSAFVTYVVQPQIVGIFSSKKAAEEERNRRRALLITGLRALVSLTFIAALTLSGMVIARAPETSSLADDLKSGYIYQDVDAIRELYDTIARNSDTQHGVSSSAPDEGSPRDDLDIASQHDSRDTQQTIPSDSVGAVLRHEAGDDMPGSPSESSGAVESSSNEPDLSASDSSPQPSPEPAPPVNTPATTNEDNSSSDPPAPAPETQAPQETPTPAQESGSSTAPAGEQTGELLEGVLIIGDSVCLGARRNLTETIPNCTVDAEQSRQIWQGYNLLMKMQESNRLREYIVIALGTNGNQNSPDKLEQLIADIRPGCRLILVTPYDGRATPQWSSYITAEYMRTLPEKYPFVTVADWAEVITPNAQLLGADKVHISGSKTAVDLYTNCIIDALSVAAGKPAKE